MFSYVVNDDVFAMRQWMILEVLKLTLGKE